GKGPTERLPARAERGAGAPPGGPRRGGRTPPGCPGPPDRWTGNDGLSADVEPVDTSRPLFGLWPSEEQDLVLRAALLEGGAAVSAFREWAGLIDLDGEFDLTTL